MMPHEPAGADHLGGRQAHAAETPDHLPIGVVGESGHRRLKQGRIDRQRADMQRWDSHHRSKPAGLPAAA